MKSIRQLALIIIIAGISGQLIAQKPTDKAIKKSMLKAYKWQQKNPNHALNDWTNGAYYIGITKAYQSTEDKAYLKGLKSEITDNKKNSRKKGSKDGYVPVFFDPVFYNNCIFSGPFISFSIFKISVIGH